MGFLLTAELSDATIRTANEHCQRPPRAAVHHQTLGMTMNRPRTIVRLEALEERTLLSASPVRTGFAASVPNDPRYAEQWALPKISAPAAWNVTTGSTKVVVA